MDARRITLQAELLPTDGLPPTPGDQHGRHVSWVELAKAPGFSYAGHWVEVDEAWIDERVRIHEARLTGRPGWFPPVLVAHEDKGERHGDVLALARADVDGAPTLLAALAWADPEAATKIQQRRLTDVSVALWDVEDARTGEIHEWAVVEVSITALPHLAGDSRILNSQTEVAMGLKEELTAAIEAMSDEEMAELKAMMEGGEEEDEDEDMEASSEPADDAGDEKAVEAAMTRRVAELERRLEASESARKRAEYMRDLPIGSTITLTAEVAEYLLPRWMQDPKGFAVITDNTRVEKVEAGATRAVVESPWSFRLAQAEHKSGVYTKGDAYATAVERAKATGNSILDEYKLALANVQED